LRNLVISSKMALQNSAAQILLRLGQFLSRLACKCTALVPQILGVESDEGGELSDNDIFFLLKLSDGRYEFHGIVAESKEDARKQAWKIPGSLMMLDSLPEFRMKLLSECNRRHEYERAKRSG
jgi:hypothetical protein